MKANKKDIRKRHFQACSAPSLHKTHENLCFLPVLYSSSGWESSIQTMAEQKPTPAPVPGDSKTAESEDVRQFKTLMNDY